MLAGILAGLAAGALWGLVFVAPRMVPQISSVDLTAARFASCGLLAALVMLATLRTRKLPTLRQCAVALGMSVLGYTGYYLLLVLSIQDIGTAVPALIIGTIPIWVMLLGKPAHLRWGALLPGLVLTALGLALMMDIPQIPAATAAPVGDASGAVASHAYWRGLAYAVTAMACWTAFALINSAWLKRHPEINATDWANWLGVAAGLGGVAIWLVAGSEAKVLLALDNKAFIAIVCIASGIGSAWVATVLWNLASQRLSASLCGQLIVAETVFALLYSFVWDGAWPTVAQFLASVLFLLGIVASIRAHR